MKEAFINKVNAVNSCLADSTQTPEGIQSRTVNTRNRRSVAMLSLALSMGATSLLLGTHSQKALAENVLGNEQAIPKGTEIKEPTLIPVETREPVVVSQVIKHEVKEGESLWQLAQAYRIKPEIIASENNLSPQSNLEVGQTISIPSLEKSVAPKPEDNTTEKQDPSLNNLRATRKKLQESLVALRSQEEAEKQNPPSTVTVTEQTPELNIAASVPDGDTSQEELSTHPSKVSLNSPEQPIPIVVPTPENNVDEIPVEYPAVGREDSGTLPEQPVAIRQPIKVPTLEEPRVVTPKVERRFHKVQPGDTLSNIARRYGITPSELAKANQIDNRNLIKINQQLLIPNKPSTRVVANNKAPSFQTPIAARPPLTRNSAGVDSFTIPVNNEAQPSQPNNEVYAERLRADIETLQENYRESGERPIALTVQEPPVNNSPVVGEVPKNPQWNSRGVSRGLDPTNTSQIISSAATRVEDYNDRLNIPVGTTVEPQLPPLSNPNQHLPETPAVFTGYIWPAKGVLTSGFGWRWGRPHRGIDIAAPTGTPIVAAAGGEVISAGWNSGGFGNLVKIKHDDGSVTLYAHNSRILVRRGQQVEQGQQISEMGSTGFSTGPHLHFEVHPGGKGAVNPIAFLPRNRS